MSVKALNREENRFAPREHHLPLGQAHAVRKRGDFRVIMTTMKLKCTYVARVIAATDDLHGWTVLRAKQAPLTRCTRLVDVPAGCLWPARKLAHLPNGTTA